MKNKYQEAYYIQGNIYFELQWASLLKPQMLEDSGAIFFKCRKKIQLRINNSYNLTEENELT